MKSYPHLICAQLLCHEFNACVSDFTPFRPQCPAEWPVHKKWSTAMCLKNEQTNGREEKKEEREKEMEREREREKEIKGYFKKAAERDFSFWGRRRAGRDGSEAGIAVGGAGQ